MSLVDSSTVVAPSNSIEISPNPPAKTSPLFCDPNADVAFISSDRVIFNIHSKYFGATSDGFAAPDATVLDQPALVPESAQVLEVLFQFIQPPFQCEHFRQPSVINMDAKVLLDVATAAEKYIVYAAMNTDLYLSHPVEVLNHAANHGYSDLADLAAAQTMSLSNPIWQTMMGLTDVKVAVKWTKYYGHWLREIATIGNNVQLTSNSCPRYTEIVLEVLHNLALNPTKAEIGVITPRSLCGFGTSSIPLPSLCECWRFIDNFQSQLNSKIKDIPKFSKISQ